MSPSCAGYMHRDLKPSNILLTKDWQAKICDFASARIEAGEEMEYGWKEVTVVGTMDYMAPEISQGLPYTQAVDVFSFGAFHAQVSATAHP